MSHWPTKKLGEVAHIIMGQSPPSSTYNESGDGLPFFQGKAEFGETYPVAVKYCSAPIRIAEMDDVFVCVRAPVGIVNIPKEKSCIGRGLAAIRADSKILNQKFLYYFLKLNENNWSKFSTGSTFVALRRKHLENLKIPLPSLNIQHQIVERLDAIRKAQESNGKQVVLTDELFQSLLNKELASKTNRWEVRKMKEICIKITDGTHKTPKYVKEGIHFISTVNLVPFANNFDFSSYEKYISIDEHNELIKRAKPEKGDILISKCGTIGRTQHIRIDYDFSIFVGLMLVKVNRKLVIPEYIECYLNQPHINSQLENLSTGASRLTLTIEALKNFKIFIPPFKIQRQIVEKLQAVQDYKKKLLEQKQKLQELFASCLDKAMKGELIN